MEVATRIRRQRTVEQEEVVLPEPELSDEDYARIMLEKAAERIESGWAKGAYNAWGNVCSVGAIGSVTRHDSFFPRGRKSRIRKLAERLLAKSLGTRPSGFPTDDKQTIIGFNDNPYTTKKEVLSKFREAASLDKP